MSVFCCVLCFVGVGWVPVDSFSCFTWLVADLVLGSHVLALVYCTPFVVIVGFALDNPVLVVLVVLVVPLFLALILCGLAFSACQSKPVFPVVGGGLVGCARRFLW